tara:strand:- start:1924 stop:2166 length:243 start_codon:yes stop_codon:yes gene_type:complete
MSNPDIFHDHDLDTQEGVDGFAEDLLDLIFEFLDDQANEGNELSPSTWLSVQLSLSESFLKRIALDDAIRQERIAWESRR